VITVVQPLPLQDKIMQYGITYPTTITSWAFVPSSSVKASKKFGSCMEMQFNRKRVWVFKVMADYMLVKGKGKLPVDI
jgi:hypothetical protein